MARGSSSSSNQGPVIVPFPESSSSSADERTVIRVGIEDEFELPWSKVVTLTPRQILLNAGKRVTPTMKVRVDSRPHSMSAEIGTFPKMIEFEDQQEERGDSPLDTAS